MEDMDRTQQGALKREGFPRFTSTGNQIAAVILHDLRECLVTPAILGWAASIPILVGALAYLIGDALGTAEGMQARLFIGVVGMLGNAAMLAGISGFIMAEDWERGALPAMLRSGVAPAALVAAHATSSLIVCLAGDALTYLALAFSPAALPLMRLPIFLLTGLPFALACTLLTLGPAMLMRTMRTIYAYTSHIVLLFVLGMLQPLMPELAHLFWVLPSALSDILLEAHVLGAASPVSLPLSAAAFLIWVAIGTALCIPCYRRYLQDLQSLR